VLKTYFVSKLQKLIVIGRARKRLLLPAHS